MASNNYSSRGRSDREGSGDRSSSRDRESSRDRDRSEMPRRVEADEPSRSRGRSESRGRDAEDAYSRANRGTGFEYQPRTAAQAQARASKGANDFDKIMVDSVKMWKPNDGDNRIRILPPTWKKPDHFGYDVHVHYGVGPDRQTYLCLNKMKGQPDPICDEHAKAARSMDSENEDDKKYLKDLSPKRRVLYYLIDRDNEREGVQAWAAPWTVDRDIVKVSVDKSNGEVLPIDHPVEGYDVEFEKKGSKERTEYLGVAIARRSSPLGKREWLDYAVSNPLPDKLNFFDSDHMAKTFGSQGEHRDRDEPRGRDRDEPRGRDRDDRIAHADRPDVGRDQPDYTWAQVHSMTGRELDDLVEQEKINVNPDDAQDDAELADWICKDLGIQDEPPKTGRGRRPVSDESGDGGAMVRDRLAEIRNRSRN